MIARALAIAIAVSAAAVGVWRGTWAVGGSDSSCYALMAQSFASGALQPRSALASDAPWPDRSLTLAPAGFIPSPIRADSASPVCAPGFSVLLAPLYLVGGPDAIFLLTPVAGGLLLYLTFVLGRQLGGDAVGLGSIIVAATMPVFVFQLVQPMNDVVVAALWMTILVTAASARRHERFLGALTGLALLVRPNLAPAAIAVFAWSAAGGWRRAAAFTATAVPFGLALLLLNTLLYGQPLRSGYGNVGDLFATAHVAENVKNYGASLLATELGFPLFGCLALFFVPTHQRGIVALASSIVLAVVAVYVFYRPLPEWWYLRFLLPALAMLIVLAMTTIMVVTRRPAIVIAVALVVGTYAVTSSAMREALDLWRLERRFRTAGTLVGERLAENAVFITVWESGSVRFHGRREAIMWDALEPSSLGTAIEWLTSRGHQPYILIEDWEEPLFRERFAANASVGQLDWPPRFDIERRVKLYRPSDRERFVRGEPVPTEFVVPNRR